MRATPHLWLLRPPLHPQKLLSPPFVDVGGDAAWALRACVRRLHLHRGDVRGNEEDAVRLVAPHFERGHNLSTNLALMDK